MINKCKIQIEDRVFNLDIYYETYEDDKVISEQENAVENFINNKLDKKVIDKLSSYVIDDNDNEVSEIDNIYKYVIPQYLYIARETEKEVVAIMCDYKFDIEHGLAIVFENGKLKEIGSQDIIL